MNILRFFINFAEKVCMKAITNKIEVDNNNFFRKHLEIINVMVEDKLTTKQIEVLSEFMSLEEEFVDGYRFNPFARKKVQEKLNLSASSLSNYIKDLIDKGAITKSQISKRMKIKDFLFPKGESQLYQIKLIKLNEDT